MLVLITFSIAAFATVALLLYVLLANGGKARKQTISRLEAIGRGPRDPQNETQVDVRRLDVFSRIPWLDALLRRANYAHALHLLLYQAELEWTPDKLLKAMLMLGATVGSLVYLRTGSLFLALMMMGAAGSIPYLYARFKRNQRFDKLKERIPESLDLMVSAIRAGHSFTSAMGLVSRESPEPIKREFRQCFDEQNFGMDMREAMTNLAYRVPTREIRMIVAAVLIQKEAGGNLTEILDKASYLIRQDYRIQRQVRVHTAQGRITGYILAVLPLILGGMLYFLNPDDMSLLWRNATGLKLLEAAMVMETVGLLIIRKIVQPRI